MTPCRRSRWQGGILALTAAAAFGSIPVFAKNLYGLGITVTQLQVTRMTAVTVGLIVVVFLWPRKQGTRATKRRLLLLVVFGAVLYGPEAFLFFTALQALPASVVELVFYIYPPLVVLGTWALYRRPLSLRKIVGVAAGTLGASLVVGLGQIEASTAVALAIATPIVYAGYLLLAEHLLRGVGVLLGTAAVAGGSLLFWIVLLIWRQEVHVPTLTSGWIWPLTIITLASLWSVPALFAAVVRIGADSTAVISTFEPVVTVALAAVLLSEALLPSQAVGGVLILAAVLAVQWPSRAEPDFDTSTSRVG